MGDRTRPTRLQHCSQLHRSALEHTNNPLERVLREIRRHSRVVDQEVPELGAAEGIADERYHRLSWSRR